MQNLNKEMMKLSRIAIEAAYPQISKSKLQFGFEFFGLDFLVDSKFKPWLIEVNTNPCLELSAPCLERLIPQVIENVFRIGVDSIFPPRSEPSRCSSFFIYENLLEMNKF